MATELTNLIKHWRQSQMDNHIYMVYDDSTPESTRDADITHKRLLDQGYRVIHKEAGYNSARYEYARVVVNS